jgi:hypothetical protein
MYSSVLALALTSCSNDDTPDDSRAVRFGTVVSPSTRGEEFTKTDLQEADYGFVVSAYNQGTVLEWANYTPYATADFMDNTKVTYDGESWAYAPAKYWPGKVDGEHYGHVSFFAIGGLKSDKLKITYNPETNKPEAFADYYSWDAPGSQYDLVAATLLDQSWTPNKQVKFRFDHILSRIGLAAKLAYAPKPGTEVWVTHMRVVCASNKIKDKGIYTFGLDNAAWRYPDEPTYMEGGTTITDYGKDRLLTDSPLVLTLSGNYMMFLPQEFEKGTLEVGIIYRICTDGKDTFYDVTHPIPAVTLLPGKQYIYTFNLTLNPVVFDVETDVTGWDEDGDTGGDLEL